MEQACREELAEMELRHIERGTKLYISVGLQQSDVSNGHEAVFRYLENDTRFTVQCAGLYEIYDTLDLDSRLNISFTEGPYVYTFTGRAIEKQRGGLFMIEQLTDIMTFNRRNFERDELCFNVQVYGLPEAQIAEPKYDLPEKEPDMTEMTFDVSSGGMCIISNKVLKSEYDPYYLIEFSMSERDYFLLPARLVRRSTFRSTSIGKYDYGFEFIYGGNSDEKGRLTKAILSRKLSITKR